MLFRIKLCASVKPHCAINTQASRSDNISVFSQMLIIVLPFKNITKDVSYISLTHYFEHIKEATSCYSAYLV